MPPTIPGGDETNGLTTRDLVLEVRADVKELIKADLPRRVSKVEDTQMVFTRSLILELVAIVGGVALWVVTHS